MDTARPLQIWKILLTIFIFFICITALRIGWINVFTSPEHIIAEDGQINLSTLSSNETVSLEGEWGFFPNEFIDPAKSHTQKYTTHTRGTKDFFAAQHIADEGYASYQLKIKTPKEPQQLGMLFNEINTAARVYINGELVAEKGVVSNSSEEHVGQLNPILGYFNSSNENINLIIHVSNHDLWSVNYFTDNILFGSNKAISSIVSTNYSLQLTVCIILLLHSFFAFSLYLFGIRRKKLIYFGMLVLITALSTAIDDGRILSQLISLDPVWTNKILYITFFVSTIFSFLFINSIETLNKRTFYCFILIYASLSMTILIVPISFAQSLLPIGLLANIFGNLYMFGFFLSKINNTSFNRLLILLSMLAISSNIVWGVAINLDLIQISYYPFDLIISILAFALYLFMHYNHLNKQNETRALQLLKVDRSRDEFLTNTSHEIRNPLHAIINIAESVMTNENLSNKSKENMALLIDVGNRLSFTLNDLSTVTQLRGSEVTLQKRSVNVHAAAMLVMNMLDFVKGNKDIELHCNIPENSPAILADENRLIQILFNLVHNAIKYTDSGMVVIEADYTYEMATIFVKDTGIGIISEPDMGERLFRPYERGYNYDYATSGIGIGLSISKQLIELHGGTITYETTKEGTTFIFTMPLANDASEVATFVDQKVNMNEAAATTEVERHEEFQQDMSKAAVVLIVDDDPVNVRVLQQVLANDYDVQTARNGKDALEKIGSYQFDLIISDVMMPYMSGYDLTKEIRKKYTISELPILLVTARNLQEDVQTAFASGANDYLVKPVNTLELKTRVAALTELKRSVKDLLRFEAAWLQAQIHPHFLFNTLNSIVSLAETDTDRMVTLIEAFGDYLQKSFSITNVEAEIPLYDELALTEAYVHIEKERFGERVHVNYDIEVAKEVLVPPLSIQPLVENAIMHGILAKAEGGTVSVQLREVDDFIEVIISDDGVGMTEEKVKEILDLYHSFHDGVGVKNTNRRLTQLYGKGLEIRSVVGEGTVVMFLMPKG